MTSEEISHLRFLKISKWRSIKTKILVFALLATIVPSLTLGWMSYLQNTKVVHQRITQQLLNVSARTLGEIDFWLKERFYDLRVFSSSYIISENLAQWRGDTPRSIKDLLAANRIKEYLRSVRDKFTDYRAFILYDRNGLPIIASSPGITGQRLSAKWRSRIDQGAVVMGDARPDTATGQMVITIAEAIKTSNGTFSGALAAVVDLSAISALLRRQSGKAVDALYLADADAHLMASATTAPLAQKLPAAIVNTLFEIPPATDPVEYTGLQGSPVVGLATAVATTEWRLVAEVQKARAYAEMAHLRQLTVLIVTILVLCIGLIAYGFGHTIVHPIGRLSAQATRVASGHLDVDIPVSGASEVSYLTQVFNAMVASLRQGREELSDANDALVKKNKELQQISITDGLTGLYNRKHIMTLFDREILRAQRYRLPLSVLMIDIDLFKQINDTYGHQAGDKVMLELAGQLQAVIRDCDDVGRYGGEEFLVVLPNCSAADAAGTAERVRRNVSDLSIPSNGDVLSITVSIGVASFPENGQDSESLISSADTALYEAKAAGRNQVLAARPAPAPANRSASA